MNIAGMIAKYFATSLAIENVVNTPRVISICLPISTTSRSLVGFESRSTMLPASLAACVPVFIATPTSACASVGDSMRDALDLRAHRPAHFLNVGGDRIHGALADPAPVEIAAAHSGLSAEGNKARADLGHVAPAQPIFFLGENNDRSAFRRLVGEAR